MSRFFWCVLLWILSGCVSSKATVTEPDVPTSKTAKTTPAVGPRSLQMGVTVKVEGVSDEQARRVTQVFEKSLGEFESCLKVSGTDLVKIVATWKIGGQGLLSDLQIRQLMPENKVFQKCTTKHMKSLVFSGIDRASGEVTLGSYWGRPGEWSSTDESPPPRFEKGK